MLLCLEAPGVNRSQALYPEITGRGSGEGPPIYLVCYALRMLHRSLGVRYLAGVQHQDDMA